MSTDPVLRRDLDLLLGHADLTDRLPHRRALRHRRRPGRRHVRQRLRGRRQGLLRHLLRRSALPRQTRATRMTSPWSCSTSRSRASPRPNSRAASLSNLSGTQRSPRSATALPGDQRARRSPLPVQRRPDGRHRAAELDQQDLAADLDEPCTGNGGTCYGDSGGPNFLGTTEIVAAITITGDAICRSTNVVYRLDTESARAFLGQYVCCPDDDARGQHLLLARMRITKADSCPVS